MCAQLTRDLFAIAKFLLTIGRLLLHCCYSLGRHVTTGTPMVIYAVLTVFWLFLTLFDNWYIVGTLLVHCWYSLGIDLWRLVHQWFECFWRLVQCTIRQKQSKNSQNSKNYHWCTNRHMSTKTVPTVYQSSKTVKTAQKWPLVYESSHV